MECDEVLAWLRRRGRRANVEGMARFGITATRAFGVSMADMRPLARRIGRDHELAAELWTSGWHEARILASLVDDPAQVTRRQMEQWVRDFDNWAVCDSVCMHLFDRTPHAWGKVALWTRRQREFQRRAGFALIASLALHDKAAPDAVFERVLPLIERYADDPRNFVKKAVNWALRQVGKRNLALHRLALDLATRLAQSESAAARWVGSDARRELAAAAVAARLKRREARSAG